MFFRSCFKIASQKLKDISSGHIWIRLGWKLEIKEEFVNKILSYSDTCYNSWGDRAPMTRGNVPVIGNVPLLMYVNEPKTFKVQCRYLHVEGGLNN